MDAGRVSEIHERIDKLSSEISRQRDILRDLENQKSAAQGELNTILDPMSRLPLEISSYIMLRCLPTSPTANPDAAPVVFLNICRAWSNIALATPSLWTTMGMDTTMSDDYGRLMGLWVARAGTHPLTLSLCGSIYNETAALQTFLELYLWDRVQTLSVYFPSGNHLGELRVRGPFPNLHSLTIGRDEDDAVRVDECDNDTRYYSRNASVCIQMLSAAPNLVECTLNGIYFDSAFAPSRSPSRAVIHSNIKALYLGGWGWESDIFSSSAYMLLYLTLPSLEHLTISVFDIEFGDFLAFLTRSAPPLRFLRMSVPSKYVEGDAPMERILRLTRRITDLNLSYWAHWIGDDITSVLRAINSPLLPDLRNLTIHFRSSRYVEPPPYEEVLGALTGRHTHSPMQAFKLMWDEDEDAAIVSWEPSPDVIIGFRKLEEDGMQIYIGTLTQNFI
ncbi:hypothetical protein B0H11DRAFT_2279910 [Mycena galericulata]|nr:hypothetical protein B0H11DRAFT_2279910 [Mycena galericulata]